MVFWCCGGVALNDHSRVALNNFNLRPHLPHAIKVNVVFIVPESAGPLDVWAAQGEQAGSLPHRFYLLAPIIWIKEWIEERMLHQRGSRQTFFMPYKAVRPCILSSVSYIYVRVFDEYICF